MKKLNSARRLIEAGHDLAVYDRVPEQIGALVEAGAKAMGSLAQAARNVEERPAAPR